MLDDSMGMFAFRAPVNGEPIPFPAHYKNQLNGKTRMARIIVFFDDEEEDADREWVTEKREYKFNAFRVNTKGWKFSREEANER